jgi:phage-related minor tail protein
VVRRGEAIMPTTRLSDGTLGIRAEGGAGASITNVVNVNVDGGAAGQSASAQDELGRRLSKQITAALQVEMGKFTQREMRPGGALYKGR